MLARHRCNHGQQSKKEGECALKASEFSCSAKSKTRHETEQLMREVLAQFFCN